MAMTSVARHMGWVQGSHDQSYSHITVRDLVHHRAGAEAGEAAKNTLKQDGCW